MAALELFANQVQTTVSSGGTTAVTAGTVQTWTVSSSLGFPAASSSASPPTFFRVTDPVSSTEKMLVTNVSGTTWTVTRGAEGTTPVTHVSGFTVQHVVTAGALTGMAQTSTTPYVLNVTAAYGLDQTGSAAIDSSVASAFTSLPSTGGTLYFEPGTYKISSGLTLSLLGTQTVTVEGAGASTTTFMYYGSGDCVRIVNSLAYGSGGARSYYSGVRNLTIDGTNATGTSPAGLHAGDISFFQTRGLVIQNFTGTSSAGLHLDNTVTWTEQGEFQAVIISCTRGVVLEVTTGTGSFGYSSFDLTFYQNGAQSCFCVINGAGFYHGFFRARGDVGGSATALTGNPGFFYLSGTGPTGSSASGESPSITACKLDVAVEPNNASGTATHFMSTFYLDSASFGQLNECYGMIDFAQGTGAFSPINSASLSGSSGYFGNFSGIIAGDSVLNPVGVLTWQTWGSGTILSSPPSSVFDGFFPTIQADVFHTTLDGTNSTVALNYSGVGSGSTYAGPQRKLLFISQPSSGGPYALTWPVNASPTNASPTIAWPGGSAPPLNPAASGVTVIELVTYEGATWYGRAVYSGPGTGSAVYPSGDTSGAADAAAVAAAVAALSGSPGVVKLSSNAPWYISCGSITCTTGQYIDATGCVIHATGAGDVFRWVDTSSYSTRLSSTAGKVGGGGLIGFPAIDGTSTTGNSCAFHGGDILQLRCEAQALNFTAGTTSKGFWFDNTVWFTEQLSARVYAQNCKSAAVFDNSSNVSGTATASFARAHVDVYVAQVTDNVAQDGVTVQNGATIYDGHLGIFGNFVTTSAASTSAVLRITGQGAGGSNTSYSAVNSGELIIGVESDTALANGPYTVYYGSSNNEIYECYGTMDFAFGHFTASNLPGATVFVYTGTVNNDAVLGNFAWSFQNVVSAANGLQLAQYATATTVTANGQTINVGAVTYIRLTATAARTGLILNNSGGLYGQLCVLVNEGSFPLSFAAAGTSTVAAGLVIPPGAQQTYVYDHFTALWYPVQPQPVFTGADGLPQATTPAGLNSYVQQSQPSAATAVTVTAASIASLGSVTVPANDPVAGARYKVTAHGTLGTASAAPTATVDLRWGGTAGTAITSFVTGTTAIALAASMSAVPVLIEGEVEFYTATTCIGWLRMTWRNNGATGTAAVALASVTSAVTVTTSSAKALSLDWTWSATGTGTTITIASSSFERVA